MIQELIALLFFSRDYGHRAHLRTQSFAQHVALDEFYKDLPEAIDTFVEAYQGRHGVLTEIPYMATDPDPDPTQPVQVLEKHLKMIEAVRGQAVGKEDSTLNNLLDEVIAVYLKALYKLRNLK
jgi:DNA-binding ferritin-like protein